MTINDDIGDFQFVSFPEDAKWGGIELEEAFDTADGN